MGNQQSGEHRRGDRTGSKTSETAPYSPGVRTGDGSSAFTFEKHRLVPKLHTQQSEDDHQPVILSTGAKGNKENEDPIPHRPRLLHGNRKMLPFVIKWTGGGNNVSIAGTFNQWQSIPMVKSEKDFVAIVDLPEGCHEYKFLVDGDWKVREGEQAVSNNLGTKNNVITINESDFDEFENALLRDPNDNKMEESALEKERRSKLEEEQGEEYCQEIPEYQQTEKMRGPPVLPPHLLQVILNKDTPISCEPTLLPEPNHVMLNHMYALSIRDGMMVLSTSHRYRKKCVTTLIYRPIE